MEAEFTWVSGLLLMFVLGLRHGLDPDHIAMMGGIAAYEIASHVTHVNDTSLVAIGFLPPLALLLGNIWLARTALRNSISLSTFIKR